MNYSTNVLRGLKSRRWRDATQLKPLHLHPPQVWCIQPLKLAGFTGYIYKTYQHQDNKYHEQDFVNS